MTISAVRRTSDFRRAGFSLLEIIIVMSLAMLVIGGAIGAMYVNRDEARLGNALQEIELLAKRARTVSSLQQRPYALEFTVDGVQLMPFAEALMDPRDRDSMIEAEDFERATIIAEGGGDVPASSIRDGWVQEEDEEFLLLVRRWASGDWTVLERGESEVWRFDPNGICEPIGVRLELENQNWISTSFHPLTAASVDIESYIK